MSDDARSQLKEMIVERLFLTVGADEIGRADDARLHGIGHYAESQTKAHARGVATKAQLRALAPEKNVVF